MTLLYRIFAGLIFLFSIQGTLSIAQESSTKQPMKTFEDSVQILLKETNYYTSIADFDHVLLLLNKLYKLRLENLPANDPKNAYSMINLGSLFNYLGEPDSAITYLKKAEKILLLNSKAKPSDMGDLNALLGSIYRNKGELTFSDYYLKLAEKYYLSSSSGDIRVSLVMLYLEFLSLSIDLKEATLNKEYISKTKLAIDKLDNKSDYLNYYLIQVANLEALAGNNLKSLAYQKEAIKICERDVVHYSDRLFTIYNNIGLNYLSLNQAELAYQYFNKALELKDDLNFKGRRLANLYVNFSYYYDKANDQKKSLEYTQKAIKTLLPKINLKNNLENPDIKAIPSTQLALEILKAKSSALYKLFLQNKKIELLDASINTGFLMLSVIEELRNGYQTFESKLKINEHEDETFKTLADYTSIAFQLTHNKKYIEFAFEISERNKSSLLLSSLGELKAKRFGEIPENLLSKEKYLSKRIAFYKELIYEEKQNDRPDSLKLETWGSNLFQSQRDHSELIEKFEKEFPKYFALKYSKKNYDIEVIQDLLPHKTSIIEYTLTDSLLLTLVISNNSCNYLAQKIDSAFRNLIVDYLSVYQNFDFSSQYYSGFTEFCWKSNELYNYLISPIEKIIKGKKLVIVPDGMLSYIPFETLIDKIPSSVPTGYFKDLSYMLDKYDISYSYSATLFNQDISENSLKGIGKLLAIAPEYNSTEIDLTHIRSIVTRQKFRKNLYPIPGVKEEVNAISKLINSDLYIGPSATETQFKNIADQYDILHLAMHTIIDNANPMYSKLIFTLNHDSINDGLLNTYEIFAMSLNARMVVLSACSTGEGEYSKGEGALSLARGFAYAGVPSLLMTLWEVEDKSGSVLMKNFYINLLKGQSKSNALRNAKIKFLHEAKMENSHPFYWSSFVLVGNPSSLCLSVNTKILIGIFLLLSLVVIIWIFIKKKMPTLFSRS